MFFDVLSPFLKPVLPNSDPKASESELVPEHVRETVVTIDLLNPVRPDLLNLMNRCCVGGMGEMCWRNEGSLEPSYMVVLVEWGSKKPPYMVVLEEWRAQGSLLLDELSLGN
ncbi:hypothetical protein GQ457_18G014490 [Hibiscus cannabinus]